MTIEEAIKELEPYVFTDEELTPTIRRYSEALSMAIEALSADRPTGKWVEVEEYDCVCYQCNQCKSEYVLIDGTPQDNDYNYCPHCGAKLGGDTE